MTIKLREATASQEIPLGHFMDSTDGNTEETGLTINNTDIKLWKTGATTLANKNSGGGTHISDGIYYAVLDATDTNTVGPMVVFVHVTGALAVKVECDVLPANIFDSLYSTDKLQVDAVEISGDSAAADNLELDYDGTGYAKANSTIGTCTTNTDMRGTDSAALAATALTNVTWTDAKAAFLDHAISTVDTNVDTLLARITAARAGYLDNLSAGAVALASALATAQGDLDLLTGADGATLATLQPNYAPNTTTPPTVSEIRTELEGAGTKLTEVLTDTGTTLPASIATAQADLDTITGADGVTLATLQALYAPNKVVPDVAGTAAGLHATTDGKVDTVDTNVDSILVDTGTTLPATLAGLNDVSAADVNAQVSDVIKTDVITEMAQGIPPATPTFEDAIMYLYMHWRNETLTTAAVHSVKNDAGTVIAKATISDDGTTFTKGKYASGP